MEQFGQDHAADIGAARLHAVCGKAERFGIVRGDGLVHLPHQGVRTVEEKLKDFESQPEAAIGVEVAVLRQDFHVDCTRTVGRRVSARGRFGTGCPGGERRQPALEHLFQLRAAVGLGQVVVHAGGQTQVLVAFHGVGGECDHRHSALAGCFPPAQCGGSLVAVQHRHLAVHQNEVEVECGDQREGFFAIVGDLDSQAEVAQHGPGHFLIDQVVFRQQHSAGQFFIRLHRRRCRDSACPSRCGGIFRGVLQCRTNHFAQFGLADGFVDATQKPGLFALFGVAA